MYSNKEKTPEVMRTAVCNILQVKFQFQYIMEDIKFSSTL